MTLSAEDLSLGNTQLLGLVLLAQACILALMLPAPVTMGLIAMALIAAAPDWVLVPLTLSVLLFTIAALACFIYVFIARALRVPRRAANKEN